MAPRGNGHPLQYVKAEGNGHPLQYVKAEGKGEMFTVRKMRAEGGMVFILALRTFNPSTQEPEAGKSLSPRPDWSTQPVPGESLS